MSILVNKNTKIITQGITGKAGQFHTRACRKYAYGYNAFVAGVNPNKAGEHFDGIPIYSNVREAKYETGATVSIIYVPAMYAYSAILEAAEAQIDLAICITEGIPIHDMILLKEHIYQKGYKMLLLGPNCPGIIIPEEIKIGIMPAHIHKKGNVGIVSRSGTLTYEAVSQLTELNIGQSCAIGIGGDPINGLKYIDIIKMFNDDIKTDAIVIIGEIGGSEEIDAAYWIKDNVKKPVIGFVAGITAPPGKQMGHAGALISNNTDTAEAKLEIMSSCGIKITKNPSKIGKLLKSCL